MSREPGSRRNKEGPTVLTSLKALGPEVMGRIDDKLMSGWSANQVARWIQDELKHLLDAQPATIKKAIDRYRLKELKPRTLKRIATAQAHVPTKIVMQRLNAMDELEEVVRHQKGRVDKLLFREAQMPGGILLKDTSNEMKLLKEALVDLGRLQLETGYMPRASRTVKGSVLGPDGALKNFEWTEEQEQMFQSLGVIEGEFESRPHEDA